jgi:serine/threonine protein kinase
VQPINLNSNSGIIDPSRIHISNEFKDITCIHTSTVGYNCLYKAKRLGKWHVLKTLKEEYRDNPVYLELLQKEFDIAYPLSHPNIVQTTGIEYVSELGLCIVMEFVEGVSWGEFFKDSIPTTPVAIKVITELCNALEYIHARQIIHRDLKPENILITRNGNNVKLIDFGLSDTDSFAILKQPAGTLRYASPEQQISNERIDKRSDIYSLGIILSDLKITGIKFPQSKRIVFGCTASERENRFSSASEIIQLLSRKSRANYSLMSGCFVVMVLIFFLIHKQSYRQDGINPVNQIVKEVFIKNAPLEKVNLHPVKKSPNEPLSKIPEPINIYNQLAQKAKALTTERCQRLYAELDTLSNSASVMKWSKKYNSLIHDVTNQMEKLLQERISNTSPEFGLYQTTLHSLIEKTWSDYYYQHQEKFDKLSRNFK